MCAEHSRAALFSTSFPASWPNRSFTCLKLSRSTNSTANASCVRSLRATSLAPDLAPPEQPVARPRQGVVGAAPARQNADDPPFAPVPPPRPAARFQPPHPAPLAEAPAGMRFLLQQLERQSARRTQMPPP